MELDKKVAGGNDNQPGGEVEPKKDDVVAHASYLKVLDEKKKIAKELEELRAYRQNVELEEKKKAGQHAEVITQLQRELEETKNKVSQERNQYAFDKFKTQFNAVALEFGCNNPEKLLALTNEEHMKMVGKDEGYNFSTESLKGLMTKLKEEHSDIGMFKLDNINHTPATKVSSIKGKTLGEMSKDEIIAQLKNN